MDLKSNASENISGKACKSYMTPIFFNTIHNYLTGLRQRFSEFVLIKLKDYPVKNIRRFINDLGVVFIYRMIGSVLISVIAVLAAKLFGPKGYGQISLVNNMSNILLLPVMVGINSSMYKYLPDSGQSRSDQLKSAAFTGNILLLACFSLFYFNISFWINDIIKIPVPVWQMGIAATIALDLYTLSESFIRGQKKYGTLARLKLAGNIVFFILFLVFQFYYKAMNFQHYFYVFFSSQMVFIIVALFKSDFHSFSINRTVFKQIYIYGFFNMFNNLFLLLINSSDLFIVNYFSPGRDVGVYSIYQGFVKNLFSIMFYEVFAVVFLPAIAKLDKNQLYKTIQRLIPAAWLITVLGTAGLTSGVVWVLGKEYGLNLVYILLVSLGIGFYTVFQIYQSIFMMEGNRGAKLCLIPLIIALPISLITQYEFTKHFGITGAMLAVTIGNLLLLLIFIAAFRRINPKFSDKKPV